MKVHEVAYNHPLKDSLIKNRLNENQLENVGNWLPIRGRILSHFYSFSFPFKRDVERKENKMETKRHNARVGTMLETIQNKVSISYGNLKNADFCETLKSWYLVAMIDRVKMDGPGRKIERPLSLKTVHYAEFFK